MPLATIHLAAYHFSGLILFKLHMALFIYYYIVVISALVSFVAFSTETMYNYATRSLHYLTVGTDVLIAILGRKSEQTRTIQKSHKRDTYNS